MLVDLVQLRTFVAVAEEQHLTRAAERLYLSPSAASGHIRAVEEALDIQLFVRTKRNLELTRAGEVLLREAQALLSYATRFGSFARELRGKMEGTLVVAANGDMTTRIGDMLAVLHARNPLIRVEVNARPSLGTRQGLRVGELDVGILLGQPVEAEFTYHRLTTVRFRAVGPVAWKAKIHAADLAALARLPWMTPRGSTAYKIMLDELFEQKGLKLNTVLRFDGAGLVDLMAGTGIGMVLMWEELALRGEREGTLAVSPVATAEIPLMVAHLATREDDPLIGAFVDAARSAWPAMQKC